jgi:hypothetical protein
MSNGSNADQRAIEDPEIKTAWSRYKEYVTQTSVLIPFPNFIYRRFPEPLRWIFLDFPIYRFNEEKEGPKALEEEEQNNKDDAEKHAMVT